MTDHIKIGALSGKWSIRAAGAVIAEFYGDLVIQVECQMSLDFGRCFLRRLIAPSDIFNWPIFGNDREITGIPFMWAMGGFFCLI